MSATAQTRRAALISWLPALLAAGGLLLAALLVWRAGPAELIATVSHVGWDGFALYASVQLGMFALLGVCWAALVPGCGLLGCLTLTWGRMVRDATGNLLPFSTLGGFVLGARAVSLHGVPFALATASTFADVTVEFLAEVSFAVLGLLALMRLMPDSALLWPVGLGLLVAGGLGAGAVLTQRGLGGIFRFLSARIAAPWFQGISGHAERLQAEIDAIYRRPKRLFAGYALHLLCWFGTAGASWLAFRLIGAPLSYPSALAIEALLHAALTAGFMIPGSLGVQELAYTGLGAMFGCPPDIALGVSLLRRARDIALGVPILILWQLVEARRAAARQS